MSAVTGDSRLISRSPAVVTASLPPLREPSRDWRLGLRWGAGVAILVGLFLWWPYQKWTFADKVSVLVGWARVLANDASGEWVFCPLVPLLSIAAFAGYVGLRRWGPRSVLFLSALPLALAGNIVRLLLLTAGTIWLGEEFAVGRRTPDGEEASWFHQGAGLAVYAVALVGLFAISSGLERSRWNRRLAATDAARGRAVEDNLAVTIGRVVVALGLAGAVLGICASEPGPDRG